MSPVLRILPAAIALAAGVVHAGQLQQKAAAIAKTRAFALEVRRTQAEVKGDIAIPEQWVTNIAVAARTSLTFRFQTTPGSERRGPRVTEWRVYEGPPPLTDVDGKAPNLRARGGAGSLPSNAKAPRQFTIDVGGILPPRPNNKTYYVQVIALEGNGVYSSAASSYVSIKYEGASTGAIFPSPSIDRVIGTPNASGEPLTKNGVPLAVRGDSFEVEGPALDEPPLAETEVHLLKDGKVVAKSKIGPASINALAAGKARLTIPIRSFGFVAPFKGADLQNGLYSVRVKNSWGTTGTKPMYLAGGQRPDMQSWSLVDGGTFDNFNWTDEGQGIATDGQFWYIVSNNNGDRALYKFTIDMQMVGKASLEGLADHAGDPDYHNGEIYIPLENPKKLLIVPATLDMGKARTFNLHGSKIGDEDPLSTVFAWVAVNPVNGYIYTSDFSPNHPASLRVQYYKRVTATDYVRAGGFSLKHHVSRVQGGDITPTGLLILASDADLHPGVYCYNTYTGDYYGRLTFPVDHGWNVQEEVEGITISPAGTAVVKGNAVNIHLMVLDNDEPDKDDVFFKHVIVKLKDLFGF